MDKKTLNISPDTKDEVKDSIMMLKQASVRIRNNRKKEEAQKPSQTRNCHTQIEDPTFSSLARSPCAS